MERFDGKGAAGRWLGEAAVGDLDAQSLGGPEADCAQHCLADSLCVAASFVGIADARRCYWHRWTSGEAEDVLTGQPIVLWLKRRPCQTPKVQTTPAPSTCEFETLGANETAVGGQYATDFLTAGSCEAQCARERDCAAFVVGHPVGRSLCARGSHIDRRSVGYTFHVSKVKLRCSDDTTTSTTTTVTSTSSTSTSTSSSTSTSATSTTPRATSTDPCAESMEELPSQVLPGEFLRRLNAAEAPSAGVCSDVCLALSECVASTYRIVNQKEHCILKKYPIFWENIATFSVNVSSFAKRRPCESTPAPPSLAEETCSYEGPLVGQTVDGGGESSWIHLEYLAQADCQRLCDTRMDCEGYRTNDKGKCIIVDQVVLKACTSCAGYVKRHCGSTTSSSTTSTSTTASTSTTSTTLTSTTASTTTSTSSTTSSTTLTTSSTLSTTSSTSTTTSSTSTTTSSTLSTTSSTSTTTSSTSTTTSSTSTTTSSTSTMTSSTSTTTSSTSTTTSSTSTTTSSTSTTTSSTSTTTSSASSTKEKVTSSATSSATRPVPTTSTSSTSTAIPTTTSITSTTPGLTTSATSTSAQMSTMSSTELDTSTTTTSAALTSTTSTTQPPTTTATTTLKARATKTNKPSSITTTVTSTTSADTTKSSTTVISSATSATLRVTTSSLPAASNVVTQAPSTTEKTITTTLAPTNQTTVQAETTSAVPTSTLAGSSSGTSSDAHLPAETSSARARRTESESATLPSSTAALGAKPLVSTATQNKEKPTTASKTPVTATASPSATPTPSHVKTQEETMADQSYTTSADAAWEEKTTKLLPIIASELETHDLWTTTHSSNVTLSKAMQTSSNVQESTLPEISQTPFSPLKTKKPEEGPGLTSVTTTLTPVEQEAKTSSELEAVVEEVIQQAIDDSLADSLGGLGLGGYGEDSSGLLGGGALSGGLDLGGGGGALPVALGWWRTGTSRCRPREASWRRGRRRRRRRPGSRTSRPSWPRSRTPCPSSSAPSTTPPSGRSASPRRRPSSSAPTIRFTTCMCSPRLTVAVFEIPCEVDKFKSFVDRRYGNCYIFNWNGTRLITRASKDHGLFMRLNVQRDQYMALTESVGMRVAVGEPGIVPVPYVNGFNVAAGYSSLFELSYQEVIHAGAPYSPCVTAPNRTEFLASEAALKNEHCAKCADPCAYALYHRTQTQILWPHQNEIVPRCASEYADGDGVEDETYTNCVAAEQANTVNLRVKVNKLSHRKYREQPKIDGSKIFSTVGGNLGIALGMSALSLIELGLLLVRYLRALTV